MQTRLREPTGGVQGMLSGENLKLKSSEMARNGSKTAKSEVTDFFNSYKTTSNKLAFTFDQI